MIIFCFIIPISLSPPSPWKNVKDTLEQIINGLWGGVSKFKEDAKQFEVFIFSKLKVC